ISHALIFPSLAEGLGLVLIEAQVSKTLCFASSVCPEESNISNLITYLPLSKSAEYWANTILSTQYPKKIEVKSDKYDIKKQIKTLQKIYEDLLK
ncbi:MAG: glycosyltransferase family 1 protein, partial [Clostridia bacterium]|nr:glycosyltransferase family 1 protein [Clostridia bacterium]